LQLDTAPLPVSSSSDVLMDADGIPSGGTVTCRSWRYNVTENHATTATLAHSNATNGTHKSRPRHRWDRSARSSVSASDDLANSAALVVKRRRGCSRSLNLQSLAGQGWWAELNLGTNISVSPVVSASVDVIGSVFDASVTVTPQVSASAAALRNVTVAQQITPVVAASAVVTKFGTGAVDVTPAVAAVANIIVSDSASVSVTPSVTVAAELILPASVPVTVAPSVSASGSVSVGDYSANASVTVAPSVTAAAEVIVPASSAVTATPSVSAAATLVLPASAPVTVTPAISASGSVLVNTTQNFLTAGTYTVTPPTGWIAGTDKVDIWIWGSGASGRTSGFAAGDGGGPGGTGSESSYINGSMTAVYLTIAAGPTSTSNSVTAGSASTAKLNNSSGTTLCTGSGGTATEGSSNGGAASNITVNSITKNGGAGGTGNAGAGSAPGGGGAGGTSTFTTGGTGGAGGAYVRWHSASVP
jgi:hypothetical protein